jgi:hypothetical protein
MATTRWAQTEAAVAAYTEVVRLSRCIDYNPIAIHQGLRVLHSWLWAAERSIIPDHRLSAHDHKVFAADLGKRSGFFQDRIQDAMRHFSSPSQDFSCRMS